MNRQKRRVLRAEEIQNSQSQVRPSEREFSNQVAESQE
jgi:hypothetical protein